ncbi:Crp/Fnr family transcriptional regulator [Ichthyenterobacterium magnum]|nr:Crp/Fnr family transcriptional regulator [Ichthyenterobacterium magnum]
MIATNILEIYDVQVKHYVKEQRIFNEHESAKYYYQIQYGSVKMLNLTEDGKEFIQGIFYDGNAFGEPPLFGDFKYPASAVCVNDSSVYVLPKASFFELLKTHPDIHLNFTTLLCKRMLYKAKIMKEVSIHPPEHRILTLLKHLKETSGDSSTYEVNLTRQQISDLTGLRVETVIRSIKKLEKINKLSIKDRKVYL